MRLENATLQEAAKAWISTWNAFPREMLEICQESGDEWTNLTCARIGDEVTAYGGYEVSKNFDPANDTEPDNYVNLSDDTPSTSVTVEKIFYETETDSYGHEYPVIASYLVRSENEKYFLVTEIETAYDSTNSLPMWGTLWQFNDSSDIQWAEKHITQLGELGVSVLISDKFGLFIGVNGAGFDFYEAFWIPMYLMRGLKWHDEATLTEADKELIKRYPKLSLYK